MSGNLVVLVLGVLVVALAAYVSHGVLAARRAATPDAAGGAFTIGSGVRQQVADATRAAARAAALSEEDVAAEADGSIAALAAVPTIHRSRCLWIDDDPDARVHERRTLELLRADVDVARSSNQALQLLVGRRYDLVVTDLERPGAGGALDERAGIKLLKMLAGAPAVPPTIVYAERAGAGGSDDDRFDDARNAGAQATVTTPAGLLEAVLAVIRDD